MKKIYRGLILILMMFAHNYVLNQPQTLQKQIQQLHDISVTSFNLLYSLPSAISIIFIIPLGILYDKYSLIILLVAASMLLSGQILVTMFGPNIGTFSYEVMVGGRVLEGTGAQVLYMIQGNLASTWMGKLAGMIFILPQCGEIANVFVTPWVEKHYGIKQALVVGLFTCFISFVACFYLFAYLKKMKKQNIPHEPHELSVTQSHQQQLQENPPKLIESEDEMKHDEEKKPLRKNSEQQKESILSAGKVFWLMIALCAINECLYFPFLDNANVFVKQCYSIADTNTGSYLCLPFVFAIAITALLGKYVLHKISRRILIFISTIIPLTGHFIIYMSTNCETHTSFHQKILLAVGLSFFGMGLGAYYSISFPAVGLSVPESIRGTGYACLCFFQTLSMTLVPLISGHIIEEDKKEGFRSSSFFFVCLSLSAAVVGFVVMKTANDKSFNNDDEGDEQKKQLMIH